MVVLVPIFMYDDIRKAVYYMRRRGESLRASGNNTWIIAFFSSFKTCACLNKVHVMVIVPYRYRLYFDGDICLAWRHKKVEATLTGRTGDRWPFVKQRVWTMYGIWVARYFTIETREVAGAFHLSSRRNMRYRRPGSDTLNPRCRSEWIGQRWFR